VYCQILEIHVEIKTLITRQINTIKTKRENDTSKSGVLHREEILCYTTNVTRLEAHLHYEKHVYYPICEHI